MNPAIRFLLTITICLVLVSCGKSSAPSNISAKAPGVHLVSFKIDAGNASDAQLQQGLQAAADALATVFTESRKTYPQLKGHLRGTFHIEPNGTPRMFMEKGSAFTPAEGKGVSDDFVGGVMKS